MLRLLDGDSGGLSLPRVLAQTGGLSRSCCTTASDREFADDRGALERAAARLKRYARRILRITSARCRRWPPRIASWIGALTVISTVKTYYWIVTDGYIDLDVEYSEDPLSIFRFAWTAPR